ncbi:MAG: hypothetical protein QM689_10190 [Oscillospiraceae bacterium]
MKKILSLFIVTLLMFSFATTAFATEDALDASEDILVENGLPEENLDNLSDSVKEGLIEQMTNDPDSVDIVSTVSDVDNLSEIENFLASSDEDLISMGANPSAITSSRKDLEVLSQKTDEQIAAEKGVSITEARYLLKAIKKGNERSKSGIIKSKNTNNVVTASGSISSSEMKYSQIISDYSTNSQPYYGVILTYTWNSVYALAAFDDVIVSAWGGNLNTKSIVSLVDYHRWNYLSFTWSKFYKSTETSVEETPNAGIEFKFPQSLSAPSIFSESPKTKCGTVAFRLYQTKRQGYDTKVISTYCHRVISVSSASIGIDSSGAASVSLSIGGAWDKTSQKSTTIAY